MKFVVPRNERKQQQQNLNLKKESMIVQKIGKFLCLMNITESINDSSYMYNVNTFNSTRNAQIR